MKNVNRSNGPVIMPQLCRTIKQALTLMSRSQLFSLIDVIAEGDFDPIIAALNFCDAESERTGISFRSMWKILTDAEIAKAVTGKGSQHVH